MCIEPERCKADRHISRETAVFDGMIYRAILLTDCAWHTCLSGYRNHVFKECFAYFYIAIDRIIFRRTHYTSNMAPYVTP